MPFVSKKNLNFKSVMPKSMHFTYLLNIDIDIAIFYRYRIDIVSKLKKNDIETAQLSIGTERFD